MESKAIANGILQALFKLLIIGGVLALIYYLNSLLIYFIIAAVISLVGRPITVILKAKLKFNNLLAAASFTIMLWLCCLESCLYSSLFWWNKATIYHCSMWRV